MTDHADPDLTPRRARILRLVIEAHIASGAPVGSRTLAAIGDMGYSPSTIRYELAWLEQAGLLDHPHTSAGRVPTEAGYRFYADEVALERAPGRPLAVELSTAGREVDAALQSTTEALAQVSNLLALVSAPPVTATVVRHVEVLLLQPQVAMVVVITASGGVEKRLFAFDAPVDPKLVEWAKEFLNESVTGTGLGTHAIRRRLADADLSAREGAFLAVIAPIFSEVLEESHERVYVGGASRLISELRSREVADLGLLAAALEERATMLGMLREALGTDRVLIRIGGEHDDPRIRPLALVAAGYGVGARNLGVVSLVGPVRMDYTAAVATVRGAAAALSDFVESVYG
jgi:heat-inducible transcriptional repressor